MAILTETVLRGYLYDWLATVVTTLWASSGTRPAGKIEFIWHMEYNARPATPILEGRLSNDVRIGRDSIGAVSDAEHHVGEQIITGDREFMLYLTSFGTGALDTLKTIRNAINDPVLLLPIQKNGIAVIECHPIVDAHVYLDTVPEDRGTMDMRLRYAENWVSTPGIIQHANINGKVDGVAIKEIHV